MHYSYNKASFEKAIKLVVVMSAVDLWKPEKLQGRIWFIASLGKWHFVRNAEKCRCGPPAGYGR